MKKYVLIKRFGNVVEEETFVDEQNGRIAFNQLVVKSMLNGMRVAGVINNGIIRGDGILSEVVYEIGDVVFAFRLNVVEVSD